jgi:hypothetical protein
MWEVRNEEGRQMVGGDEREGGGGCRWWEDEKWKGGCGNAWCKKDIGDKKRE